MQPLIHLLIHLFDTNPHIHRELIRWYRTQQPGMPHGWYPGYVRYLIHSYPRMMWSCLHAMHQHATSGQLLNTCP